MKQLILITLLITCKLALCQSDNIITVEDQFNNYLEVDNEFRLIVDEHISKFKSTSKKFCKLNSVDKDLADRFLYTINSNSFLPKKEKQNFYIQHVDCFTEYQKDDIRKILGENLDISDVHYIQLVSKFNLVDLLQTDKDTLSFKMIEDIFSKGLASQNKIKDYVVLANQGNRKIEEVIVKYAVDKSRPRDDFFSLTIPFLNTKESVLKTLHFLDSPGGNIIEDSYDLSGVNDAYHYYIKCIHPKLKESELKIRMLDITSFEKNKEYLIEKILSDDSIWKEGLIIERQ